LGQRRSHTPTGRASDDPGSERVAPLLSPPIRPALAALPRASGLELPAFTRRSPGSTRLGSKAPDRQGLALDVGQQTPVAIPLQPLLDEGPEDDLEAHRQPERGRRLAGK